MRMMSTEQVSYARAAWEAGEPAHSIAAHLGVAEITIYKRASHGQWDAAKRRAACRVARSGKFAPRPIAPRKRLSGSVRELFEAGAPMPDILAAAGMSDSGLRERAVRERWDNAARDIAIRDDQRARRDNPRCHDCGEAKPRSEFYDKRNHGRGTVGRDGRCKTCSRMRARLRDERLATVDLPLSELCAVFASAKRCAYCDKPLGAREKTLDHVIPLSRGGAHERENLAVSCRFCNTSKGARTPLEWVLSGRAPFAESA